MNKKSFTLAEVLISLTIIGIVAAITVPLIFENYRKEEIKTKVKKDYSVIMNALRLSQSYYGVLNDNSSLFLSGSSRDEVAQNFVKFIPNAKLCLSVSTDNLCKNITSYNVLYTSYKNKYESLGKPVIILPDGGYIYIYLSECKCVDTVVSGASLDSDGNSVGTWTDVRNHCGMIYFDVNGSKQPNKFGYDAFGIAVFSNFVGKGYWDVYGYPGLESILKGGEPIYNTNS